MDTDLVYALDELLVGWRWVYQPARAVPAVAGILQDFPGQLYIEFKDRRKVRVVPWVPVYEEGIGFGLPAFPYCSHSSSNSA